MNFVPFPTSLSNVTVPPIFDDRICNAKGKPDWQVTLFDDSWGFLCGSCGCKLSENIGKGN